MGNIAIFAYDFPHRKSYDFILDLVGASIRNLVVFGAPRKDLSHLSEPGVTVRPATVFTPLATADLCQNLEIPYFAIDHNDAQQLEKLISQYAVQLAIISGARILSANVIALFAKGIINFHPGKIPETSGLDAFFYTLKNGAPAGVTTHYIDHRVDAGKLIRYSELIVNATDEPDDIIENTYQLQRMAIRELIADIKTGNISEQPIVRPAKNKAMTSDEKREALSIFPLWKSRQLFEQAKKKLFYACEHGYLSTVLALTNSDKRLISEINEKGWTPLIVACFNQNFEVVKLLLSLGADPNRGGFKGTTPLMYAKTKLINQFNQRYEILNLLIQYGADCKRTDAFGKNILHYVEQANDDGLTAFFRQYS